MDKEIVLKDEDFGKKYSGKYVFRSIGWGLVNRISAECTKVEPASQMTTVDVKALNAKMIMATLIIKPDAIKLEHLLDESDKGLPPVLGEFLMMVTDLVNGYGPEQRSELKKLKEQWDLE